MNSTSHHDAAYHQDLYCTLYLYLHIPRNNSLYPLSYYPILTSLVPNKLSKTEKLKSL